MKIQGFFRQDDNAPYVVSTIIHSAFNLNRRVRFLLDSGASSTVIADTDARYLKIDYNRLQRLPSGMTGIGGTVETFVLPSVRLVFATGDGTHEEELERVYVLRHQMTDARQRARIERIPSLLGRDVLNNYMVILQRSTDTVLMTDEDIVV